MGENKRWAMANEDSNIAYKISQDKVSKKAKKYMKLSDEEIDNKIKEYNDKLSQYQNYLKRNGVRIVITVVVGSLAGFAISFIQSKKKNKNDVSEDLGKELYKAEIGGAVASAGSLLIKDRAKGVKIVTELEALKLAKKNKKNVVTESTTELDLLCESIRLYDEYVNDVILEGFNIINADYMIDGIVQESNSKVKVDSGSKVYKISETTLNATTKKFESMSKDEIKTKLDKYEKELDIVKKAARKYRWRLVINTAGNAAIGGIMILLGKNANKIVDKVKNSEAYDILKDDAKTGEYVKLAGEYGEKGLKTLSTLGAISTASGVAASSIESILNYRKILVLVTNIEACKRALKAKHNIVQETILKSDMTDILLESLGGSIEYEEVDDIILESNLKEEIEMEGILMEALNNEEVVMESESKLVKDGDKVYKVSEENIKAIATKFANKMSTQEMNEKIRKDQAELDKIKANLSKNKKKLIIAGSIGAAAGLAISIKGMLGANKIVKDYNSLPDDVKTVGSLASAESKRAKNYAMGVGGSAAAGAAVGGASGLYNGMKTRIVILVTEIEALKLAKKMKSSNKAVAESFANPGEAMKVVMESLQESTDFCSIEDILEEGILEIENADDIVLEAAQADVKTVKINPAKVQSLAKKYASMSAEEINKKIRDNNTAISKAKVDLGKKGKALKITGAIGSAVAGAGLAISFIADKIHNQAAKDLDDVINNGKNDPTGKVSRTEKYSKVAGVAGKAMAGAGAAGAAVGGAQVISEKLIVRLLTENEALKLAKKMKSSSKAVAESFVEESEVMKVIMESIQENVDFGEVIMEEGLTVEEVDYDEFVLESKSEDKECDCDDEEKEDKKKDKKEKKEDNESDDDDDKEESEDEQKDEKKSDDDDKAESKDDEAVEEGLIGKLAQWNVRRINKKYTDAELKDGIKQLNAALSAEKDPKNKAILQEAKDNIKAEIARRKEKPVTESVGEDAESSTEQVEVEVKNGKRIFKVSKANIQKKAEKLAAKKTPEQIDAIQKKYEAKVSKGKSEATAKGCKIAIMAAGAAGIAIAVAGNIANTKGKANAQEKLDNGKGVGQSLRHADMANHASLAGGAIAGGAGAAAVAGGMAHHKFVKWLTIVEACKIAKKIAAKKPVQEAMMESFVALSMESEVDVFELVQEGFVAEDFEEQDVMFESLFDGENRIDYFNESNEQLNQDLELMNSFAVKVLEAVGDAEAMEPLAESIMKVKDIVMESYDDQDIIGLVADEIMVIKNEMTSR